MKKTLLFIFLILSSFGFTQNILMQNGSVTTCSGTFYDSGGESSYYSNNENLTLTICPDVDGNRLKLEFTNFEILDNIMTIYDGDSTSAPIIGEFSEDIPNVVFASFENTSGCLTIKFVSNNSLDTTTGWAASISCVLPCQNIIAQLDSTLPLANTEDIIEVCVGDNINLNGSGFFEVDGTGATYTWDLGDGNEASGQSVNVSYQTPGVYLVNLDIRDTNTDNIAQGCSNSNSINQVIRVSGEPDFTGTEAEDITLCYGDTTTIEGVVNPLTLVYNCPPPESEETYLPDGSGAAYETSIAVTCFDPAQTLTDVNQITSICLNMEHSWSNDIEIDIISPNGQTAQLFDRGGGGTYFGGADNLDSGIPGVGADYCFSLSGSVLLNQAPTIIAGFNPPSYSWEPGTYLPVDDLSSLLGSPLNGEWTIRVVDNLHVDDGYIFSWELNFDDNLQLQDFDFVPSIVSQSWDSDPSITEISGNTITIAPDTDGEFCYIYRTVDVFGCEYTEEVCVNVTPQGVPATTYYEDLDGDGYGDPNSTILDCSDTPPFGYVVNGMDCNDVDNSVNPDAEDSEGNGVDENCDGVDGNALSIEEVRFNDFKITPNPFNTKVVINLPSLLIGRILNVNIYDLNGRLMFNKTYTNTTNKITVDGLNPLENAAYFISITNEETGFKVVKKLIKI